MTMPADVSNNVDGMLLMVKMLDKMVSSSFHYALTNSRSRCKPRASSRDIRCPCPSVCPAFGRYVHCIVFGAVCSSDTRTTREVKAGMYMNSTTIRQPITRERFAKSAEKLFHHILKPASCGAYRHRSPKACAGNLLLSRARFGKARIRSGGRRSRR